MASEGEESLIAKLQAENASLKQELEFMVGHNWSIFLPHLLILQTKEEQIQRVRIRGGAHYKSTIKEIGGEEKRKRAIITTSRARRRIFD